MTPEQDKDKSPGSFLNNLLNKQLDEAFDMGIDAAIKVVEFERGDTEHGELSESAKKICGRIVAKLFTLKKKQYAKQ